MNPDDYDEDGNNIVPCPICLDVHCPSKEDGKCPEEAAYVCDMNLDKLKEEIVNSGALELQDAHADTVEDWLRTTLDRYAQAVREEERKKIMKFIDRLYVYAEEGGQYQYDPCANQALDELRSLIVTPHNV